jgi:glucan-binding YG repeat protein
MKHEKYDNGSSSTLVFLEFKEKQDINSSKLRVSHYGEDLDGKFKSVIDNELALRYILKTMSSSDSYITNIKTNELTPFKRVLTNSVPAKTCDMSLVTPKGSFETNNSPYKATTIGLEASLSQHETTGMKIRPVTHDKVLDREVLFLTEKQTKRVRRIIDDLNKESKAFEPNLDALNTYIKRLNNWYYKDSVKADMKGALYTDMTEALTRAKEILKRKP